MLKLSFGCKTINDDDNIYSPLVNSITFTMIVYCLSHYIYNIELTGDAPKSQSHANESL